MDSLVSGAVDERYEKKVKIPARRWDFDRFVHAVAEYFDIDPEILFSPSKKTSVSRIRSIICFLAMDKFMISRVTAAGQLGLSPSGVSKLISRGRLDDLSEQIAESVFDDT